ncbi:hypothetical protein DFH06DRAFT_1423066 [Mycena polygramma]|nr:hypothetical protein DFH06DRAFT_1423066 [Mycena polygramma]
MFEDAYEADYVPDFDEDDYEEYVQTQARYHNENRLAGSTSDEDEEEEDGESKCNDGKRIQYLITFQPQLLPPKPNECYIRAIRLTISGISSADSDRSGRVGRLGGPEIFGTLGNPRSHRVITQRRLTVYFRLSVLIPKARQSHTLNLPVVFARWLIPSFPVRLRPRANVRLGRRIQSCPPLASVVCRSSTPTYNNEPKRRSNARAEKIKTHVYLHEKRRLGDVLDAVIKAIVVGQELRTTRFKVNWTISRTDYKNMQLASVKDFDELVKQVMEKAKAVVTLEMKEEALEVAPSASDAAEATSNADGSDRPAKKQKVTAEEEEMSDIIAQLHSSQRCSDQTCTSQYCFVGNATAKHVRLTPFLLNIWAAAILAKMPAVDVENPPPADSEKAFWPVENQPDDVDDIALLAARRRTNSANSAKSNPSVVINNDFAGLAAILTPFIAPTNTAAAAPSTPLPIPRAPASNASPGAVAVR